VGPALRRGGAERVGGEASRTPVAQGHCSRSRLLLPRMRSARPGIGGKTLPRFAKRGCSDADLVPARTRCARANAHSSRGRAVPARTRTARGCARCPRRRPLLRSRASFAGDTRSRGRWATRVHARRPHKRISRPSECRAGAAATRAGALCPRRRVTPADAPTPAPAETCTPTHPTHPDAPDAPDAPQRTPMHHAHSICPVLRAAAAGTTAPPKPTRASGSARSVEICSRASASASATA